MRIQTKKITIEPKSYTVMLLYLFFDYWLSTCLKKMKNTDSLVHLDDRKSHFATFCNKRNNENYNLM